MKSQLEKSKVTAIVVGGIVVAITTIVIFALSQPKELVNPITVSTDRSYYESGNPSSIMVTVNVKPEVYKEGELVELQIVDANRTQYTFYPTNYDQPGVNVTYPLKLGGRQVAAGEYWVLGSYREYESQTSFQYEGFKPDSVTCQHLTLCTYQLKIGSATHPINFRMNGTIEYMVAATEVESLTIELNSEGPTALQIAIPREVVDADTAFAVFVDTEIVEADEMSTRDTQWAKALGITENPEEYRILIIPIQKDSNEVEIIGDFYL